MIRIVVDTNVIVSAYLTRHSNAERILSLAETGHIELCLSPSLFEEIEATLLSPKLMKLHRRTPAQVRRAVILLKQYVTLTSDALRIEVIQDDPDDNKVLACALECGAEYLVSGDHHLTDLKTYEGVRIVSPATFLEVTGIG